MCAQHALNAILQGQFFDPSQLAQIADEISEYERNELGISTQDAKNISSRHMDETGFFSLEVVDRALRAWDMSCLLYTSPSPRD